MESPATKLGATAARAIDLLEERARDEHGLELDDLNVTEVAVTIRYEVPDQDESASWVVYLAVSQGPLFTAGLLNDAAKLALQEAL